MKWDRFIYLGNGKGLVEIAQRLQLPVLSLDSDVELRRATRHREPVISQNSHLPRANRTHPAWATAAGAGTNLLDTLERELVLLHENPASRGFVSINLFKHKPSI
jgi:hypothetical protein